MKCLLIDGNSLINRAFYALPVLSTDEGVYTNAVYGFLKMFYKLTDEYAPDHVVCAFDVKHPTFRHERYAAYKAGRKPMPPELVPQIPLLRDVLEQLGVFCFSLEGFEADDILGTYARLAGEADGEAVILTGDRDAFQLIDEHTSVWFTKKGISELAKLTLDNLKEFYGVRPDQVVDLKALMGDSSDNIPGVAGVGEKTALSLMEKYETLDNVLAHAQEVPGKLGEKIRGGQKDALDSRFLATIVRTVPVAPLENARYCPPEEEVAQALFARYQFRSLLKEKTADAFSVETKPFDAFTMSGDTLALAWNDREITVACDEKTQYVLPLAVDLLSPGVSEEEAARLLKPFLEDERIQKVFFDSKSARRRLGAIDPVKADVMLAEYLLSAGGEEITPERVFARYSCEPGAGALLYISAKQEKALSSKGMTALYRETELPLARVLFDMEEVGFFVKPDVLRTLGAEFSERMNALSDTIFALAGREFNINSPLQLADVLFVDLGLPARKKTKRGYSTDNDVLETLEHPIIEPIMEYRQVQKLKSTYIDAMFALISPKDGRIHTTFRQAVASTGRLSSTEPNLQNIPVRSAAGREIRRAFCAEKPGAVLVNADYSQIELRLLAHLSGDETLQNAFINGQDIHARTAAEVFGVPLSSVTPDMRSRAKAVNFGIVYGISDFGLAKSIHVSRREAAEFIDLYFARYPRVKAYLDETVASVKRSGAAHTILGRRREIPQVRAQNYNIRAFGERAAMNAPIQGSAADIIKLAMLAVWKRLNEDPTLGKLILQVHDELIVETDEARAQACAAMLKETMESVMTLSVPLEAEAHIGKTWYELK